MLDRIKTNILRKLYFDKDSPALYSGQQAIYHAARKKYPDVKVTLANVQEFLQAQNLWAIHKSVRKRFPRLKTSCVFVNQLHETDLADFQRYRSANDGMRYILVVVDCASRFAWARPIQTKSNQHVVAAFESIYGSKNVTPKYLMSDEGTEYTGHVTKQYFAKQGIISYTIKSIHGAALAERFIRTLKTKLYKYFTDQRTHHWLDVLPKFIKSYNTQIHSALAGKAPADITHQNQGELFKLRQIQFSRTIVAKYSPGDLVRLVVDKAIFTKGYEATFSAESYAVESVRIQGPIVTYKLTGLPKGLQRRYYEPELVGAGEDGRHRARR